MEQELHEMTLEEAEDYVFGMEHYGEVYNMEDAIDLYNVYIKDNKDLEETDKTFNMPEWYCALNMMVNDYDRVIPEEQELAELAYAFLIDADAPEYKLERYLIAMSDNAKDNEEEKGGEDSE